MMFISLELTFMTVVGIDQTSQHPVQGQPCILFKYSLGVPEVVFIFSSLLCALSNSLVSSQLSDRADKGRSTKRTGAEKAGIHIKYCTATLFFFYFFPLFKIFFPQKLEVMVAQYRPKSHSWPWQVGNQEMRFTERSVTSFLSLLGNEVKKQL